MCNDDDYGDMIDGYSTSDGKDVRIFLLFYRSGIPVSHSSYHFPRDPCALQVCNKIAQNKSKCDVYQFKGFANMTGVIKTRDMYWFVLANCNQTNLNVEVRFLSIPLWAPPRVRCA